jgi:hypothetical protein
LQNYFLPVSNGPEGLIISLWLILGAEFGVRVCGVFDIGGINLALNVFSGAKFWSPRF